MDKVTADSIPDDIESGTLEYWKARARQCQKRCYRAEREKSELIEEIADLKAKVARMRADRRAYTSAVDSGDVQPVGRDYAPRRL